MPKGINPNTGKHYRFKDRSGQRAGRLVFTRVIGVNDHKHTVWEAVCDCGNITATATPSKTLSCGCLQKEVAAESLRKRKLSPEEKAKSVRRSRKIQKDKVRSDPVKAMQARLSRLHRHAISQIGAMKNSPTFEQLGYTPEDLKLHIERQFTQGMGWHNMSEWQIDHIIPASTAETMEDVVALNQLSNLRPMWAGENNRKRNNIESLL